MLIHWSFKAHADYRARQATKPKDNKPPKNESGQPGVPPPDFQLSDDDQAVNKIWQNTEGPKGQRSHSEHDEVDAVQSILESNLVKSDVRLYFGQQSHVVCGGV